MHVRVYNACEGEKVQNIEQQAGNTPTWDTEEPDESVTGGAGCGSVDAPFTQTDPGNMDDTTWAGFFEGNLDTLTVHAHNIYVGPARATGEFEVAVKLFINGRPYFPDVGGHVLAGAQPSITFNPDEPVDAVLPAD